MSKAQDETSGRRGLAIRAGAVTGAVALAFSPSLAVIRDIPNVSSESQIAVQKADAVALVTAIRTELQKLPSGATPQDIEASIAFVLSQKQYDPAAIALTLNGVEKGAITSASIREAVANVRTALLMKKLKRGTAALDPFFFGSGFSSPVTVVGGGGDGTTNYSG